MQLTNPSQIENLMVDFIIKRTKVNLKSDWFVCVQQALTTQETWAQLDKYFHDSVLVQLVHTMFEIWSSLVYGFFDSRQPVLLIRDPDIIKQITVKDFNHFINHRALFNDENDKNNLFGSSLVSMRDSRWKDMRSTLSPAFTGSKMRQMFRLMNDVAVGAVTYLKQQQGADPTYAVEVDVTNFATRYSNDVIASTAFGLEINSFVDNDNEFYLMGKRVTTPTFFGNLRFMLYIYFNGLMKFLKIGPFDKRPTEYFMRLVISKLMSSLCQLRQTHTRQK
ncbi:hypothetical protein GQX74_012103 [Glossina fuscipes]|nr:hypothetical protein GQX74_012103 [Glossina fuscipes]